MNFSELLDSLQKLKSEYKINQMSIAEVLGLSRQTMSKRFQLGTEVSVSELQKIEEFYGVSIYKSNIYTLERQNDTSVREKTERIGHRLGELQDKHEYLDKDMAKLLHISEEEYIDLKLGDTEPDFNTLVRLKQCFKVSIDWLLFGD